MKIALIPCTILLFTFALGHFAKEANPTNEEVLRNLPVRQPVLWVP